MTSSGSATFPEKSLLLEVFGKVGRTLTFEPGKLISRFDDDDPRVFLILKGTIGVHVAEQDNDNELTVTHLVPMDLFGLIQQAGDDGINTIALFAQAKTQCTVLEVEKSRLFTIGSDHPEILMLVCSELSRMILGIARKVGQLAFFGARGRVSNALTDLCALPESAHHPKGILLTCTRTEIAAMVGCTREMVGKIMKDLSLEGLITIIGRQTIVHHAISPP